jgi:glycosyltransferase involved in cell wall biosynthesis
MIVKNEAQVIRRCLDSVRPMIDYWLIVDTGSSDGTQDIIREHLHDLPGELLQRPWRDFAHNRSEALALAREKGAYSLIIDADDTLEFAPEAAIPQLTADSYSLDIRDSGQVYRRSQLVSNALPWRYEGVLHEYLTCDAASSSDHLTAVWMRRNHDGARRKDPETYRRDAAVLEAALRTEQSPFLISRYRFYLAQSYRDSGEPEKALHNYLLRAELGFWIEEVFVSLYRAAQLKEQLGYPDDAVVDAYLRASNTLSTRAEALHAASRFCRNKDRFEQGYQTAKRGLAIHLPSNGLFVEPWIYEYGLLDELSIHSFWTGRYPESLEACRRLLSEGKMPDEMRDRVNKNAQFSIDKLGIRAAPQPPPTNSLAEATPAWTPAKAAGGTELMVGRLRERIGDDLERINLQVNRPWREGSDKRPTVAWMHHDVNQAAVQWCKDRDLVNAVSCFVFVSYWQREQYLRSFDLPPQDCVVIKHALEQDVASRRWDVRPPWRFAYASTPFRGLSVLLDAWRQLDRGDAELHIWSSMKLYALDDTPYEHLYERARSMPGVIYHGLAPNDELRAALRTMHFLAYPCTFAETACWCCQSSGNSSPVMRSEPKPRWGLGHD